MDITYQKEVGHCEVSKNVKAVTIKNVSPAENSDFLECVTFEEIGWNVVTRKDIQFKKGDKVTFIPPESILPLQLSEELGVTNYLSKGRVKVAKLRGNRSEGLIVDRKKVDSYLPYILKWEDLPTVSMMGDRVPPSEIPYCFEKFHHMPNIMNEPKTFASGEIISYSEKVHGTNVRMGYFINPETQKYQLYVGSHNIVLKESEDNLYWRVVKEKLVGKLPPGYLFFGEIFGAGVQDLNYGLRNTQDVLLFAAMENGRYLTKFAFTKLCEEHRLPRVFFEYAFFRDIEKLMGLANLPSGMTDKHGREGIVITSVDRPEVMAKCFNFEYLVRRNKKERK